MNENEKRLFADVAAEDKEYMRVMASAKRSSIFMCAIWSVFAIVMGIMMKDLYMLLLILAMALWWKRRSGPSVLSRRISRLV